MSVGWAKLRVCSSLALACGAWLGALGQVSANGRMPGANDLAFDEGQTSHMLVRATYGLVQSFDAGKTWQWVCEQAIDVSGVVADPPVTVTEDGSLVLLPPTGSALVSHDFGCSWSRAPAPLAEQRGVDLTLDPHDAAHVYVLMSTIAKIDDQGYGVFANRVIETKDNAQTWTTLATLPTDFEAETIEVAASDGQRIYVSGTASVNPRTGILYRSEDGGQTWLVTTHDLPAGTGSLLVSAVAPNDADTLWLRVPARGDTLGLLPGRLYLSVDKGQTLQLLASTKQGMFGFALSPDGKSLAYGGPGDGLFVGPADGSQAFEQRSKLAVRCLRWPTADALFACGSEPQDAFSLGVSKDQGRSFTPLYQMLHTCPQECGAGTSFAMTCEQAWGTTRPFIRATGAMCMVPWAAPAMEPDAGLPHAHDAGATLKDAASATSAPDAAHTADAGSVSPAAVSGAACSCRLGARRSSSPAWFVWLMLCGGLIMRTVRRSARFRARARDIRSQA